MRDTLAKIAARNATPGASYAGATRSAARRRMTGAARGTAPATGPTQAPRTPPIPSTPPLRAPTPRPAPAGAAPAPARPQPATTRDETRATPPSERAARERVMRPLARGRVTPPLAAATSDAATSDAATSDAVPAGAPLASADVILELPPRARRSAPPVPASAARPLAQSAAYAQLKADVAGPASMGGSMTDGAGHLTRANATARSARREPAPPDVAAADAPLGDALQGYLATLAVRRKAYQTAQASHPSAPPSSPQRGRGEEQPPSDERSEEQGGRKPRSLRHGGPVGARESGLRRGDAVGADGGGRDGGAEGGSAQAEREVCPICGGAGYLRLDVPVGDPSFGQPVPCECKERENEERRRRKLDHFSSLKPFNGKTFETFDARDPRLREAFEIARQYAREPEGWLVLRGNYGTGKTHLAAAIAHERLAAGTSVFFAIVPDLLDHLRGAFAPSSEVTYSEMFDDIREVELLVLDDLGTENATAWATEKLFQLINYRYNYHMPTVITTNDRINARMDERIRSRLSDIAFVQNVALDAPDRRPRNLRPNGANGPNGGHGANGSGGQGGVAAYGNGGYGARGENVELDERQQRYERRGGASERPSDRPRGRYER